MFGETCGCQQLAEVTQCFPIAGFNVCQLGCVGFVDIGHGCIPSFQERAVTGLRCNRQSRRTCLDVNLKRTLCRCQGAFPKGDKRCCWEYTQRCSGYMLRANVSLAYCVKYQLRLHLCELAR